MKIGQLAIVVPLLLFLSACVPRPVSQPVSVPRELPQLAVSAEASVEVAPDQLQLRLGVVTQGKSADQALQENNLRMITLMAQLRELGVGEGDLQTGQFQVRPQWSVPPRPTPAGWQRTIVGYQVSNELLIATSRLDLAGDLLGMARDSGANQVGSLQFTLTDPESHQLKAIALATKLAGRKAKTLAEAAGAKLGEILSLTVSGGPNRHTPQLMVAEARTLATESVPVASGKVTVTEGVSIVYRLVNPAGAEQ